MTVTIPIGPNWTEIATGPVLIQCKGATDLTLTNVPPSVDEAYHRVTDNGLNPYKSDGKIWARAVDGTANVIVAALPGGTEGPS